MHVYFNKGNTCYENKLGQRLALLKKKTYLLNVHLLLCFDQKCTLYACVLTYVDENNVLILCCVSQRGFHISQFTVVRFSHMMTAHVVKPFFELPYLQSTLVISNSKGPAETLRDIRTSTYQICRIEENTKRTTKFHK